MGLRHRASTLANPDDILKVAARHLLASTLTNTVDKADDITRGGRLRPTDYSRLATG